MAIGKQRGVHAHSPLVPCCELRVQDCLLQAALSPPQDARCKAVVEMAASVGVMYLSTMAGDLEPPPLVMLATLLNNNYNLLMVENLMAAVWTLLRNPHNRKILATAFQDNPVLSATLRDQMQVCVWLHRALLYHVLVCAPYRRSAALRLHCSKAQAHAQCSTMRAAAA